MKSGENGNEQGKLSLSRIAVIGMGYVGLPLAVEFARQYPTTGFDIKQSRIVIFESTVYHLFDPQLTDVRL